MRDALTTLCEGVEIAATLDRASGTTGLLIVSGGNEIRIGAHRGMAILAADIAARGYPVLRFDRRGIGDSEGENGGFETSGPDINAAIAAFRAACPQMARVVAFGNCDAATALVIHDPLVDALVLANPWVVAPFDNLPPPAAIKDRYSRRLRDPAAWAALLTGKVDLGAMAKGLGRIALPKKAALPLALAFAEGLIERPLPTTLLLAARDATALGFIDAWKGSAFAPARARRDLTVVTIDSASHSFADAGDYDELVGVIARVLG